MSERVLLASSGGVDSSVAALLLKEQGYDVHCCVFIMSDLHLAVAEQAGLTASELGLPLEVLDLRSRFEELIASPFREAYCCGKTPSPCVICNPLVKFDALVKLADNLGIDKIATGHYADLEMTDKGVLLKVSEHIEKDQSYMLYRLPQSVLSRLILPLSSLTKTQVRAIAKEHNLSSHSLSDSQENCFIPDADYISYLEKLGCRGPKGFFILPNGDRMPHEGIHRYTVGQRKGLGISYAQPLYVKAIDPKGDVFLCCSGGEYSSSLKVTDAVFSPCFDVSPGSSFTVKIRSAAKPVSCTVNTVEKNSFSLSFSSPVRAVCPGQSAVLYAEGAVVGGGIIE